MLHCVFWYCIPDTVLKNKLYLEFEDCSIEDEGGGVLSLGSGGSRFRRKLVPHKALKQRVLNL